MGKYTKIKADGGPIKGKKKPAIKVSDPNDLNLQAYKDSTTVANYPYQAYLYHKKINDMIDAGNTSGALKLLGKDYPAKIAYKAAQKRLTKLNGKPAEVIKGGPMSHGAAPTASDYPVYKEAEQPYEYSPYQEKLNINSIPINGSTTRNTIQGINVPNPPTPINPKPWDSLQLYSGWENLGNQGYPVGYYDMNGTRNYIGLDEYNKMNTPQYQDGGPIRTYNLNDPRLLAYNDSLSTYNNATAVYNNSLNNLNTARTYDEYIKRQNDILNNSGHINHSLAVKHPDVIRSRRWGSQGVNFHDNTHFVKPKRRVEYTPYSKTEPLDINQIPITGTKDTNPYNSNVVSRYLPTPQSPTNPIPYEDIQLFSAHQNLANAGKPVGYVVEDGKKRDIMADEYNAIMNSSVQGGTKLENTNYAMGGMIKRKDGSYSKRGLWDNIRANKGSGKKPTKEMLEQERKIKAKYPDGGPLNKSKKDSLYVKGTPYLKSEFKQYSSTPQEYINDGYWNYRNPALDSDLENNLEYVPFLGTVLGANDASAALHKYSKNPTKGNKIDATYETASLFPLGKTLKITKPGAGLVKSSYKYLKLPINAALDAVTDERIVNINPATKTGSKAAKTNSNVSIRKSKFANGGPLKYDMYGTPIESNIQPSNVERSYYDPRTDTIYLGTDYNQMDDNQKNNLLAHENYHSMQFKGDKSTFLPTDTGIKKPAMMSTDDVYYSYHNRQPIEAQQGIDDFRQANPSFNLVPDDLIYNNVVDYSQYLDPNTMEGGAKFYGDTGQPVDEDFYGKGGYIVTRSKDRKGKTHKVTGPDGTVKYFGDSKLGQHPNDPARKKAFYARHAKNLKNNPHFRAFARKTWADGGYMGEETMAMGGRMNQAQQLNAGKMRTGSEQGNSFGDYAADYGNFLLDGVTGIAEGLTGAEIYNPTYNTKLGKIAGAVNNQSGKMMGKIAPMALNMVAPGVGTAVGMAGKAVGTGLNASKNEEANGQLNLGNSMLPNMLGNNMEGIAQMETMGAAMQFKQGGLMHINEGGTHEQNALGGVPIGPNALVEQGETINNDFVFSDRLKPKGSKKTYAQLSKSVDTKYRLRPDDKLSKEAKQMDLDKLAAQQEAQKDEMSAKYMQKAMACGGKIGMAMGGAFQGPISQSIPATNGQNTLLAYGGSLMSNFMEPEPVYQNPANQYAMGGYADQEYDPSPLIMAQGGIHIKPENRGKFTASANRAGMGVQEFAGHVLANKEDYSSTQVKRANFARNASKWKHAMGGNMYGNGGGPTVLNNPSNVYYNPDVDQNIEPYFDQYDLDSVRAQNFKSNPNMDQTVYSDEDFPNIDYTGINQYNALDNLNPPPIGSSRFKKKLRNFNSLDSDQDYFNSPTLDTIGENNAPLNIQSIPYYNPQVQGRNVSSPMNVVNNPEANFMGQTQGNALDKYASNNQNPYGEVGNTGYLTNLAGNLVKAGMVATSKPPIYNPSVKFGRMNANPAERLAMQEGRREIQGTKDIIRNNATSSGQYLTNASLMGSSAANKLAGTIGGIRQGYDQQNVGIGNQEAQLNQQITAANNLAKEQFRDNRLNQYNKILDSVIGANQQRFATDVHANNYQNQVLDLLKSGDYQIGFDANGKLTVIPTTK